MSPLTLHFKKSLIFLKPSKIRCSGSDTNLRSSLLITWPLDIFRTMLTTGIVAQVSCILPKSLLVGNAVVRSNVCQFWLSHLAATVRQSFKTCGINCSFSLQLKKARLSEVRISASIPHPPLSDFNPFQYMRSSGYASERPLQKGLLCSSFYVGPSLLRNIDRKYYFGHRK